MANLTIPCGATRQKNEKFKNPRMCVPAECKVAASVQKSGQNINFKKSYLKKCVSKIADF